MTDLWDPAQYDRFQAERRMPFDELVGMCRPVPGGVVHDLGCGTGALTAELVDRLEAGLVIGHDTSDAMLDKARPLATDQLRFVAGDLASFGAEPPADIVFSNAALQWVDDHPAVLERWRGQLATGGQLAFQVPWNIDHPAYLLAPEIADGMADRFPDGPPPIVVSSVLRPEQYAEILHRLGGADIHVGLRVFCHLLDQTSDVVEWIKGTALTRYQQTLEDDDAYEQFVDRYRTELVARLGDQRPYLFTFKRILAWARFAS